MSQMSMGALRFRLKPKRSIMSFCSFFESVKGRKRVEGCFIQWRLQCTTVLCVLTGWLGIFDGNGQGTDGFEGVWYHLDYVLSIMTSKLAIESRRTSCLNSWLSMWRFKVPDACLRVGKERQYQVGWTCPLQWRSPLRRQLVSILSSQLCSKMNTENRPMEASERWLWKEAVERREEVKKNRNRGGEISRNKPIQS